VCFFAANLFAQYVMDYGNLIAFGVLVILGGKMIWGSFKKSEDTAEPSVSPKIMIPLALATSVDAMAVGVSFAFVAVNVVAAVITIGVITFALCTAGVRIGGLLGAKFRNKAEFAGGVILVLMGVFSL
jgi:putative Mn2+ efflux pump MntP